MPLRTLSTVVISVVLLSIAPRQATESKTQPAQEGPSVADLAALRTRLDEADAERLRTKPGTTDRAAATWRTAARAADVAWALYRRDAVIDAGDEFDRTATLRQEGALLWAGILDADGERLMQHFLEFSTAGSASGGLSVEAGSRLKLHALESMERSAQAREVQVSSFSSEIREARALSELDLNSLFAILLSANTAMNANRGMAVRIADERQDIDRHVRAASELVAWARVWTESDFLGRIVRGAKGISEWDREAFLADLRHWSASQLAIALEKLGDAQRMAGGSAAAQEHYAEALAQRRTIPEDRPRGGVFNTLGKMGELLAAQGRTDEARAVFEQAVADLERHQSTVFERSSGGRELFDSNELGNALANLKASLGRIHQGLAAVLESQGHYAAALQHYRGAEQAIAQFRDRHERLAERDAAFRQFDYSFDALSARADRTLLQARLGGTEAARSELNEVVDALLASNVEPTKAMGLVLRSAALDASLGDDERARATLSLALRHFRAAKRLDATIFAALQLAAALDRLGRHDEAARHAEDALQLARGTSQAAWRGQAATALARIRLNQGATASVSDLLETIRRTMPVLTPQQRAAALVVEGRWHQMHGRISRTVPLYQEAAAAIEHLRAEPSIQDAFFDVEAHYEPYERLVRVHIEQQRIDAAFSALQSSRRKELRQAHAVQTLTSARPELRNGLIEASALEARIQTLAAAVSQARSQRKPDPKKIAATEQQLNEAVEAWRTASAALVALEPAYTPFVSAPPVRLADVQAALPPRTALLAYVAPADEELDIFVVTREHARVRRSPAAPARVWGLVNQAREAMEQVAVQLEGGIAPPKEPPAALRDLYDALLTPVLEDLRGIERVAIMPTRSLHYLPFQALARRTPEGFRYLLDERDVVYLSGAALDSLAKRRPAGGSRPPTLAALGNATGNLAGADAEVDAIGRLFRGARILKREAATPRTLRGSIADTTILHLAVHGRLVQPMPSASHLLLAPDETSESGHFTVSDIRGLDASGVGLVTLAACLTSRAQRDPRGLAAPSLSDAFLTAGAASVVGTLWSVEDRSTQQLMTEFYRQLRAGRCKDAALRTAQLSLRRSGEFTHPYYWSGFLLFGDWAGLQGGRSACAVAKTARP